MSPTGETAMTDALAAMKTELDDTRARCLAVVRMLRALAGEFVAPETLERIARHLEANGTRAGPSYLGAGGVRDPELPCHMFAPGTPTNGGCEGDGHYLCARCVYHAEEAS